MPETLKPDVMENKITLKRIVEIANDVKDYRLSNDKYTSEEEELWRILDSVLESGYDMAMRIHQWEDEEAE